jgi:hypothetical protein
MNWIVRRRLSLQPRYVEEVVADHEVALGDLERVAND